MSNIWGLTSSGFIRKLRGEIEQTMFERLRTEWQRRVDLGNDSVIGALLRVESYEDDALWRALESTFYSIFRDTASAPAQDDLAAWLDLVRFPARAAIGSRYVNATPGTVISAGTRVQTLDNLEYVVLQDRTIPNNGQPIDLVLQATETGPEFNLDATAELYPISGTFTINTGWRTDRWEIVPLAASTQWITVEPNERFFKKNKITFSKASLTFPSRLDKIMARFQTPPEERTPKQVGIYWEFHDPATGLFLGSSTVKRVTFQPDTPQLIEWEQQALDLSAPADEIEAVLVVSWDSESAIMISGMSGSHPLSNQDNDPALTPYIRFTTAVTGDFTGGRFVESVTELRFRMAQAAARGATSIPEAIEASLWSVEDVRHVRVDQNKKITEWNGMPPKSVRPTVAGGVLHQLGAQLVQEVAAGIECFGTEIVRIDDGTGQIQEYGLMRPTPVRVVVEIEIDRGPGFPPNGVQQIKDRALRYLGGTSQTGRAYPGLGVGQPAYTEALVHEAMKVGGLKRAQVRLAEQPLAGETPTPTTDAVTIEDLEIIESRLDLITVV